MSKISKGKQKIIQATMKVLREKPIEDVTMRVIAKEAGVTTGSLYHHYKNKDELCVDVMQKSLHFTTRLYDAIQNEASNKKGQELLDEINTEVAKRLSKTEQNKLHIQYFSDMIKQKSIIRDKYHDNYNAILDSTANLLMKAFNVEDNSNKRIIASILVAAIDGMAMQQAIEVTPFDDHSIKIFIDFFNESIPKFMKTHK